MAKLNKKQMIDEILLFCKTSNASSKVNVIPLDEVFLSLAFMDESQLTSMCQELNIKTK